jgi:hypothetical protein
MRKEKAMAQTSKIKVQGLDVGLSAKEYGDYINLTDIARRKNPTLPAQIIMNWLRNADTIDFIGLWEKLNNPNFNLVEFDEIKSRYGRNVADKIIQGVGLYGDGIFRLLHLVYGNGTGGIRGRGAADTVFYFTVIRFWYSLGCCFFIIIAYKNILRKTTLNFF